MLICIRIWKRKSDLCLSKSTSVPKIAKLGWGFVAINDKATIVIGYGLVRNCGNYLRIGPVYAEIDEVAMGLMKQLLKSLPSKPNVFMNVPSDKRICLKLVYLLEMNNTYVEYRCHIGPEPNLPHHKRYAEPDFWPF